MPELVGQRHQPPPVVLALQRAAGVGQVGDVHHLRQGQPLAVADHRAHRGLRLAEPPGEVHLLLVAQRLVVEHHHGVAVDRGLDPVAVRRRQRPGDVHPADLGDEQRMQFADLHGHGVSFFRWPGSAARVEHPVDVGRMLRY
jgi:hypothetical protein